LRNGRWLANGATAYRIETARGGGSPIVTTTDGRSSSSEGRIQSLAFGQKHG